MIDFNKKNEQIKEADEILTRLKSVRDDTFAQYCGVNKITDIEIARVIIVRLLDELS